MTVAAVVILLVAIVLHVSGARDELSNIRRLSIPVLLATCVLQFMSQLLLNGSFLLPLRTSLKALGFWELYLVRTGGMFAGALVPVAGGLAVRLAYLRSRGLTYADFMRATLLTNVLALASAAMLAVCATALLWMTVGSLPTAVVGMTAGLLAIGVAAVAAFLRLPQLTRRLARRWNWLIEATRANTSVGVLVQVAGLGLGRHLVNYVSFGFLYQSLTHRPEDFLTGGVVYALTTPVRIVMITPANIGVAEWFVALVGKVLAFDVTTGLIVALAFRGVALVAQAAGALFGSAWIALGHRTS